MGVFLLAPVIPQALIIHMRPAAVVREHQPTAPFICWKRKGTVQELLSSTESLRAEHRECPQHKTCTLEMYIHKLLVSSKLKIIASKLFSLQVTFDRTVKEKCNLSHCCVDERFLSCISLCALATHIMVSYSGDTALFQRN